MVKEKEKQNQSYQNFHIVHSEGVVWHQDVTCEIREHVGFRAFKFYIFVMALVFLGIGFTTNNRMVYKSKEWVKLGVPLGAVIMVVYYVVLFVLKL